MPLLQPLAMLSFASSALAFNAAPLRVQPVSRASVSMAVEDLVGGINDPIFGGTPEGKIFDPLGLGADEASLYRRRVVEIKHGRICMVATLGMTVGPNDLVAPSHALLAPSLDLHFDDIPGGIAAISAVPAAGWLQILALVGVHELTVAKQDYTKVPGEINTFLGFKPDDPEVFKSKQLKELKNGRLAVRCLPSPPPPVLPHLFTAQSSGLLFCRCSRGFENAAQLSPPYFLPSFSRLLSHSLRALCVCFGTTADDRGAWRAEYAPRP